MSKLTALFNVTGRIATAAALSTSVLAFAPHRASAQAGDVTFTLINGTSEILTEFYASPPDVSDWEEDILGEDVLDSGESVTINVNDGRSDCLYDFKSVFSDGTVSVHEDVSVCDGEIYTLSD